jgi:glycosidase
MRSRSIELVYFDGCPNAEEARANLRAATDAAGGAEPWSEWNLSEEDTPDRYKRFGSPTVLVDGEDVTGANGGNAAMACRSDGAPSVAAIREALSR